MFSEGLIQSDSPLLGDFLPPKPNLNYNQWLFPASDLVLSLDKMQGRVVLFKALSLNPRSSAAGCMILEKALQGTSSQSMLPLQEVEV